MNRVPLAVTVIAAALLTACGAGSPSSATQVNATKTEPPAVRVTSPPPSRPTGAPTAPPSRPTGPPTALPVVPGAGALPQTRAFPSTHSAAFRDAMQDL